MDAERTNAASMRPRTPCAGALLASAAASAGAWAAAALLLVPLLLAPPAARAQVTNSIPAAASVPASAARAASVAVTGVRVAGDETRTRLVLDLSRAADYRVFTLDRPHRVVLDLSDVAFTLETQAAEPARGLVSAYRFGVLSPGKARLVLEVTRPVAVEKTLVVAAVDGQPARLVIDLVPTDAPSPVRSAAVAAPSPAAAPPDPAPANDGRPVIVLDPGHGGIDNGTTGASAFNEKSIVLETALLLRDKLEQAGRYRVVMTRTSDTFVALGERVRIARRNRAALFISIHADALAAGDGQARGSTVYTLSDTASDADAAHLAEKENRADLIAGFDLSEESDEVAGILFDLAQRETRSFSALFARSLVGAMKQTGRLHRAPLKSAGFRVLKAHDVPSVLVELGYMSNPQDLKLLTSDAWRERVADAMAAAVDQFFETHPAGAAGPAATARAAR